jgi:uridylate kinase
MNKNIVIKIGGSLLFSEGKTINSKKITEFCNVVKNNKEYDSIVIVCGGGIIAREYIDVIRDFTQNEALCDLIGIDISRINSRLIISNLKEFAYPQVPKSIEELSIAILTHKIVVMGGLQPGQSTTSVAIEVAEYINANILIILTDVEGIFDKDPKLFKDAKLIKKLSYNKLRDIILHSSGDKQAAAGEYRIFDAVSLQILKRSKITIMVFKNFWDNEKEIIGTTISN